MQSSVVIAVTKKVRWSRRHVGVARRPLQQVDVHCQLSSGAGSGVPVMPASIALMRLALCSRA